MRGLIAGVLVGVLLAAAGGETAAAPSAPTRAWAADAVIGKRVLGHSVKGRPIVAWRLGERGARRVVLISTMHGNESHTRRILTSLRDGPAISGLDLWVIPVYNPDGLARGTRKNARGVDLNRNYPHQWADLDGRYESGPRPASEPETRAVLAFLNDIRPHRIVSFHQPLYGVDRATKDRRFARRLSRHLNLPLKRFSCGGVCHGTMTGWYNARFPGAAVTVEYDARPSWERMAVRAPRQLLRALGGTR